MWRLVASSSAHPLILHSAVEVRSLRWLDPNQFPADSKTKIEDFPVLKRSVCNFKPQFFSRIVLKLCCEVPFNNTKWMVGPRSAAPVERVSRVKNHSIQYHTKLGNPKSQLAVRDHP